MSTDEIRWWLMELHRQGWSWQCLGRTLGISRPDMHGKADGSNWIYRSEQIRFSFMLKRIISGELVQVGRGTAYHQHQAVQADHPQPVRTPPHWHINLARGTAELRAPEGPAPILPSFKTLLENPRWTWRE
jgi:hypothetical protein